MLAVIMYISDESYDFTDTGEWGTGGEYSNR
jgi:hypothetical protein